MEGGPQLRLSKVDPKVIDKRLRSGGGQPAVPTKMEKGECSVVAVDRLPQAIVHIVAWQDIT